MIFTPKRHHVATSDLVVTCSRTDLPANVSYRHDAPHLLPSRCKVTGPDGAEELASAELLAVYTRRIRTNSPAAMLTDLDEGLSFAVRGVINDTGDLQQFLGLSNPLPATFLILHNIQVAGQHAGQGIEQLMFAEAVAQWSTPATFAVMNPAAVGSKSGRAARRSADQWGTVGFRQLADDLAVCDLLSLVTLGQLEAVRSTDG
jgi:hypothetical protein